MRHIVFSVFFANIVSGTMKYNMFVKPHLDMILQRNAGSLDVTRVILNYEREDLTHQSVRVFRPCLFGVEYIGNDQEK